MIGEVKTLHLRDKTELFVKVHEKSAPIWIITTHGVGEHCGRHAYMNDLFSEYFNILQYDLRGHGRSHGKRGYVENFEQFALDLKEIIEFAQKVYGADKIILFGHSMGALITAQYVQQFIGVNDLYPIKVFLSAPPVKLPGILGNLLFSSPYSLSKGLAKMRFSVPIKGMVDLKHLSHDVAVGEAYKRDEFNLMALHSKLLFEMINASRNVFTRPLRVRCPLHAAVGSEDKIVDPVALIHYFQEVEKNCNLQVIKGGYHELHNEIKKYRLAYFNFLKGSFMDCLY